MGKGQAATRAKPRRADRRKARTSRRAPRGAGENFPEPASGARIAPEHAPAVFATAQEPAIRVRASTPADAAVVSALWLELGRLQEGKGKEWALAEGAAERFARGVQAAAGNPRSIYLIAEAEIGGGWKVAGFLHARVVLRSSVYRESVVGEIAEVHVASDARGRGAGTALAGAALDWFRKRGIASVLATIDAGNAGARSFFESLGLRESAAVLWAEVPPGALDPALSGSPSP